MPASRLRTVWVVAAGVIQTFTSLFDSRDHDALRSFARSALIAKRIGMNSLLLQCCGIRPFVSSRHRAICSRSSSSPLSSATYWGEDSGEDFLGP